MKLTPDDPNIISPPSLLSVSEIALQIGRTPAAVAVAIRRLGIRPSLTGSHGHFKWYPSDAAEMIAASMRKPNRRKER